MHADRSAHAQSVDPIADVQMGTARELAYPDTARTATKHAPSLLGLRLPPARATCAGERGGAAEDPARLPSRSGCAEDLHPPPPLVSGETESEWPGRDRH